MPDGEPSIPRFEFATASRIVFGEGVASTLPEAARSLASRLLLVTGAHPERHAALADALCRSAGALEFLSVSGEPRAGLMEQGAQQARSMRAEAVVGIGGGSVIDAAKAVAALAANPGGVMDYLEVAGSGRPLERPALPCIAVPTTAGTGAEVTRNAVLSVPDRRVKASLRHASMLPRVALVDPLLTHGLPAAVTAATGMDALTQLIEPFLCSRANPVTDALCADGIRRAARALPALHRNPADAAARADLSLAALFSGMALANAGLGAVHGLAAVIGGRFPAPHGAVCAALLPHVLRANLAALQARAPGHPAAARMALLARMLAGNDAAGPEAAADWCSGMTALWGIPSLPAWGVRAEDAPAIASGAAKASSMKANPVVLTQEELEAAILAALKG